MFFEQKCRETERGKPSSTRVIGQVLKDGFEFELAISSIYLRY
jgi:hypothetical protein